MRDNLFPLSQATRIGSPLVLLLPNLDSWIFDSTSVSDGADDSAAKSEDVGAAKSGNLYHSLIKAVDLLLKDRSVCSGCCVIATATTAVDILNVPAGRKWFNRQLLVPLPDATVRQTVMADCIHQRSSDMLNVIENKETHNFTRDSVSDEIDANIAFVSGILHGYTQRFVRSCRC